MFPLPRTALCVNEAEKTSSFSQLSSTCKSTGKGQGMRLRAHCQEESQPPCIWRDTGSAPASRVAQLVRGEQWSRVTIALWWRGLAWGLKAVVVLLYHVTFLPVTDMSMGSFLWQQEGGSWRKTQDLAEKLLTGKLTRILPLWTAAK